VEAVDRSKRSPAPTGSVTAAALPVRQSDGRWHLGSDAEDAPVGVCPITRRQWLPFKLTERAPAARLPFRAKKKHAVALQAVEPRARSNRWVTKNTFTPASTNGCTTCRACPLLGRSQSSCPCSRARRPRLPGCYFQAFASALRLRSKLDHDLECLAFVHCAVALGHLVDAHDPVEDATGLDPAFEDVRQEP